MKDGATFCCVIFYYLFQIRTNHLSQKDKGNVLYILGL